MKEDGTFEKVKEFVRQQQEQRGREYPVRLDEISEALGISEELIMNELAHHAGTWSLIGMDLYVTFRD